MRIDRIWAMPNKWTFTILPIKELLKEEKVCDGLWIDPFAGRNSSATITNDINPDAIADYHLDALTFLQQQESCSADGILFDPPYSVTQAKQCYDSYGVDKLAVNVTNSKYWSLCKYEVARILKTNGKVISFGWNSNGIGKNRGFEIERILLVAHGSIKNDTIVTVEKKVEDVENVNLFDK